MIEALQAAHTLGDVFFLCLVVGAAATAGVRLVLKLVKR
ncbi:hypothetical protein LCGC14_0897330 [marine sediment metagenome]|uniref:Uncharacterized protein n=1 Tax=marine sediment metagenome TaxID=412755 RepID=A0A0F9PI87_9ZZZZ